jgi:hypothetical protein
MTRICRRIEKRKIKKRVYDIYNDEDVVKIMLDDKYLLVTWDYSLEELTKPMSDFSNPPLWDWFSILNIKTKKLWYIDFTCPFVDDYWHKNSFDQNTSTACIGFYYRDTENLKINFSVSSKIGGISKLSRDSEYEKKIEWYKKYNNWDLTFKDFNEKNEINRNWNEGVKTFKHTHELNSFAFIAPYSYSKTEISIVDVIRKGLNNILSGKVIPKHQNGKYAKLIQEIEFDMFLYEKEKSSEMFI